MSCNCIKKGTVTIKATTLNKSRTDKVKIKVSPEVTVSNQERLNQVLKQAKPVQLLLAQ